MNLNSCLSDSFVAVIHRDIIQVGAKWGGDGKKAIATWSGTTNAYIKVLKRTGYSNM